MSVLLPLLQAGAAGVTLLFFGFFVVVSLAVTAVTLYAVYWTYKDATRRGMDNPELWAVIVFVGTIPGLVAYLLVRE